MAGYEEDNIKGEQLLILVPVNNYLFKILSLKLFHTEQKGIIEDPYMKKLYALVLICSSFFAVAQQDLQFTQYMFNRIYYNPGVAGSTNSICITGVHRSQWVGFDGAPTSDNLNANIPLDIAHGGIGVKIARDALGYFQNINASLGYAYQHQLPTGTLGFGVGFDVFTSSVTNADWEALESMDPLIPAANTDGATFDMSFGIYYETDRVWAGISSNRLLESATELDASLSSITRYYNKRHYYLMGGYNWQIPATNWELRPSTLVKTDLLSSPVVDVNVTGVYNNKFWGGVSYRLTEAVGVNIGYEFTQSLMAGYAYDIPITEVSSQGGGSHEVFLRYCFKVEIPPRQKGSYKNPRFL